MSVFGGISALSVLLVEFLVDGRQWTHSEETEWCSLPTREQAGRAGGRWEVPGLQGGWWTMEFLRVGQSPRVQRAWRTPGFIWFKQCEKPKAFCSVLSQSRNNTLFRNKRTEFRNKNQSLRNKLPELGPFCLLVKKYCNLWKLKWKKSEA